jgi:histidine triad (HIT) family protein
MSEPDCPICRTIAGEASGQIIDQDDRTVAFMHAQPATRGHALVVPRRHARDLLEIADEDLAATVDAAWRLAARVMARLGADGVNLINGCGAAAWQTVAHFHIHVIPRYQGEELRLAWRSSPGGAGEITAVAAQLRH